MHRITRNNIQNLANQSENLLKALDETIRNAPEHNSVYMAVQLLPYKENLEKLAKIARDLSNQTFNK